MKQSQTPRRTQAERTRASREKIIHSAIEAFARNGFRGAKLADIAKAAGLTEPGLLHHFPSKTHLLMEVLKERDRIDSERMRATLQKNGNQLLEAGIELVKHNQTVPGLVQLFNLLVTESISPDHPAHEFFIERYQRERGHWIQAIVQAQQAGEIRSDISPEALAVLIFAIMDGLQMQWLMEPEKIDMAGLFRVMMNMLKAESGR
ncbi:MAG: TetR/AcrR family transcriptional regulator [Chloroflexi bacterium]|nr:TetR/AcrR family transcriptional regulator [Chloroflexota bacterium]